MEARKNRSKRTAHCKNAEGLSRSNLSSTVAANASEGKPHKGRPNRFSDSLLARVHRHWPEAIGRRAQQDKAYLHRAIMLLGYSAKYAWLGLKSSEDAKSSRGFMRMTVLSQLGRIEAKEKMREFAFRICCLAPQTQREAVKLIRKWQTRGDGVASHADAIAVRINDEILRYKTGMPSVDSADVLNAIEAVSAPYYQSFENRRTEAARVALEITERTDALRVLLGSPRCSRSQSAAMAVVLIMPLLTRAAFLRQIKGVASNARRDAGGAAEAAASLFGVSSRYIRDAQQISDRDPALFARLLSGKIELQMAKRLGGRR